jgi:hypothetical protein
MPDLDLDQLRNDKWRLNGIPARTIEDARSFLESGGFLHDVSPAADGAGAYVHRRLGGVE